MTTDRTFLTIKQAAQATGVSQRTIRRRVAEGAFPGAHKAGPDPLAAWLIPTEELAAAGLYPRRSAPAEDAPEIVEGPAATIRSVVSEIEVLRAENLALRHRLELVEQRAAFAEQIATERLQRVDEIGASLRAVTEALEATTAAALEAGPSVQPRRSWWHRKGGGSPSEASAPTG